MTEKKRKDGDKMTQIELLQHMFWELSQSLETNGSQSVLQTNYEHQLACYEKLFDAPAACERDRERGLVCGRCLIALSRSLLSSGHTDESLGRAKRELCHLKPLFAKDKQPEKTKLKRLVEQRISSLSPQRSDEISDAMLFLYLSLVPTVKGKEEEL